MHSGSRPQSLVEYSNAVPRPSGNEYRPPTHHTCSGTCAEIPPLFHAVQLAPGFVLARIRTRSTRNRSRLSSTRRCSSAMTPPLL
ncbi:unnamed protein product [Laminaria digitata]